MFALKNNLTAEEMNNMTLGELKEMHRQAMNDTALCNASACPYNGNGQSDIGGSEMSGPGRRNGMGDQEMRNGFYGEAAMRGRSRGDGPMGAHFGCSDVGCNGPGSHGAFPCQDNNSSRCDRATQSMARSSPVLLLMGDLTVEDLGNMTLNEIRALTQEKMQELNNMTLAEVSQLKEKRISQRDNMTLSQLREENRNMRQMARIIHWAGSEDHFTA
jgi:hypothetical protein